MLDKVSWGDYFTAVLCVAFLFYIAVVLLFYRSELQSFLQRKTTTPGTGQDNRPTAAAVKDQAFLALEDNTIADLHGILEKAGKGAGKAELISQLGQRLAGYAGLRHPAFRTAIANQISDQAFEICGAEISSDELKSIFEKLAWEQTMQ